MGLLYTDDSGLTRVCSYEEMGEETGEEAVLVPVKESRQRSGR